MEEQVVECHIDELSAEDVRRGVSVRTVMGMGTSVRKLLTTSKLVGEGGCREQRKEK